jgi:hypothetical protein
MAPLLGATRANIRFTWDAGSGRGQSQFGPAVYEANRGMVLAPRALPRAMPEATKRLRPSNGAKRTMRTTRREQADD